MLNLLFSVVWGSDVENAEVCRGVWGFGPAPALAAHRGVPYPDGVSMHITLWKTKYSTFLTTSKLNSVELLKLRLLLNIVLISTV